MKRREQREKAAESARGSKPDIFGVESTEGQRSVTQEGRVMRLLCLCFHRNTHIWREDALFFSFLCPLLYIIHYRCVICRRVKASNQPYEECVSVSAAQLVTLGAADGMEPTSASLEGTGGVAEEEEEEEGEEEQL